MQTMNRDPAWKRRGAWAIPDDQRQMNLEPLRIEMAGQQFRHMLSAAPAEVGDHEQNWNRLRHSGGSFRKEIPDAAGVGKRQNNTASIIRVCDGLKSSLLSVTDRRAAKLRQMKDMQERRGILRGQSPSPWRF
jgi:hypothetical protein